MSGPYSSAAWQKTRRVVLDRDNHICQLRRAGCSGAATAVDHIISPRDGGAMYDPDNCRASCGPCNSARSVHQRRTWTSPGAPRVVLWTGPAVPATGAGRVVVSLPALAQATGSTDTAVQMWAEVLTRVRSRSLAAAPDAEIWLHDPNANVEEVPHHEHRPD